MNLNVALLLLVLAGGIGGTAAVQAAWRRAADRGRRHGVPRQRLIKRSRSPVQRGQEDMRVSDHAMGWVWYGRSRGSRAGAFEVQTCRRVRAVVPDRCHADLVDP